MRHAPPPPPVRPTVEPVTYNPPARALPGGTVALRYMDVPAVAVRGPATGREYSFSGFQPVQEVDARDAAAMLRTRYFQRAG